jgi:hypothetical protein
MISQQAAAAVLVQSVQTVAEANLVQVEQVHQVLLLAQQLLMQAAAVAVVIPVEQASQHWQD